MSGLREALAEVMHGEPLADAHPDDRECWLRTADDALAFLADPERRDEMRALWGEEQVGRAFVGPAGQHIGAYQTVRLRDGQPVYAEKETP